MQTYIAILRGINVGGKRIIKMQDLKNMLAAIGMQNTQTYIQSGNIVFSYKQENTKSIAAIIEKNILENFNLEVPVIVLNANELGEIINANTYIKNTNYNIDTLHVTILNKTPLASDCTKLETQIFGSNTFKIIKNAVYLFCPNGYSDCKLTNNYIEKQLQVTATTRNWKTIVALQNIIELSF